MCWDLGAWADRLHTVRGKSCNLSSPQFSPQASWLGGIAGSEFGLKNRFQVFEALDADRYFKSTTIPGAFQFAWVDNYTALVTAKVDDRKHIYRCRTGGALEKACSLVWSKTIPGRYSTWVIPLAPQLMSRQRDHDEGFAIWPEHRGVDARTTCSDPPAWRHSARTTAEQFGREILEWPGPEAEIDRYSHAGVHVLLHRGDGPQVQLWLAPVTTECWIVFGVRRAPDRRPQGVSASVRGRRVSVGVFSLGARSSDVIVGFNGREVTRVTEESSATIRLDFKPHGSGFFLILLRDRSGRVFSAAGALLHPGLVAG